MVAENSQPIQNHPPSNPPIVSAVAVSSPAYQPIHQLTEATTVEPSVPYSSATKYPRLGSIDSQQHSGFPVTLPSVVAPEGQRSGQSDEFRRLHTSTKSDLHNQGFIRALDGSTLNLREFLLSPTSDRTGPTHQSHDASSSRAPGVTNNNSSLQNKGATDQHLEDPSPQNPKSCCCGTSAESTSPVSPAASAGTDIFPFHGGNMGLLGYHLPTAMQPNKFPEKRENYEDMRSPHSNIPLHPPPIPHTTVYSMPATYATAENPLTQRQQAYFQQNGHFYSQNVPHYAPLGVVGSAAPSADGNAVLSLTHSCTCGPSCQCVFCVAHPYNATTRDRVQTLAHLLPDDVDFPPKNPTQDSYTPPFQSSAESNPIITAPNRMHINEILHPSDLPQSTHFSSSDFSHEVYQEIPGERLGEVTQPAASSSGYLTMEYEYNPLEMGRCTDATGTCRCGDDCTCIGCWTHSGHEE